MLWTKKIKIKNGKQENPWRISWNTCYSILKVLYIKRTMTAFCSVFPSQKCNASSPKSSILVNSPIEVCSHYSISKIKSRGSHAETRYLWFFLKKSNLHSLHCFPPSRFFQIFFILRKSVLRKWQKRAQSHSKLGYQKGISGRSPFSISNDNFIRQKMLMQMALLAIVNIQTKGKKEIRA